jgi:alkanesulfonate monooxygenase SsuD/methylene tetrahydromethanopterin reductase-like flavin-dependent oxidoreductase (luciferase family)
MASGVRFGLTLSNRGVVLGLTTPDEILEMAELADDSGAFDHVWVGDQIMAKPRMESLTLMAAIAARTRRVRIGPACMASFPSRHPVLLAYQWASLDLLSNGRMILAACMGVPEGSNLARLELRNMGIRNEERGPRLEEGIEILRRLWTEERVTFRGRFYDIEDAFVEPKPVQSPPPIWVTGRPRFENNSPTVIERNLRRVARLGDGWLTTGWPVADFVEMRRRIYEYADEYGRSFAGKPCALYYNVNVNDDREAAIEESRRYLDGYYAPIAYSREAVEGWVACGPPQACAEQIGRFIDAGATDILLRFPSWDQRGQFRRTVEEVLPRLRAYNTTVACA